MPSARAKKVGTKKSTTSRKRSSPKKGGTKRNVATKPRKVETTVLVDRRSDKDRRTTPDRRKRNKPVAIERRKLERRAKVNRRRQIDPTTCERDYTQDEIEFMSALDEYKRASGRMFPTCSEILEVIRKLGYEKRAPEAPAESTESAGIGTLEREGGAAQEVRPVQSAEAAV